jgi:hypothetical protein
MLGLSSISTFARTVKTSIVCNVRRSRHRRYSALPERSMAH